MKIFITSDLHFFHKNIIDYENRPFKDIDEMHNVLIKNWNNTVSKSDKIFIAGDLAFTNKENTVKLVQILNGYKILILGNHDRNHSVKWWYETGFNEIYKYPIVYKNYIISHEPVNISLLGGKGTEQSDGNIKWSIINLHGHLHTGHCHVEFNNLDKEVYKNVGVDVNNFKPVLIEEIE